MTTNKITAIGVQDFEPRKNVFTGFHATGLLAKWPIIGLIMFIFGSLMFGCLTYNLYNHGPLLAWDKVLSNTLPAIALKTPVIIKVIMEAAYYIGNEVIIVLLILLGFYFIYKRLWNELALMAIGMTGQALLFLSLTKLIARPRPPTQLWIILKIPGFPSGHAIAVIVFYGLMAYLLVPNIPSAFWKAFVVAVVIFIIGLVGFSRVFTGGHYLTDVLAGYAIGIGWSGLAYTLLEIYFQKRRSMNAKKG
jgi:membrane-associated phospholipid phosphatase